MDDLARQPRVEAGSVHEAFVPTPANQSLLADNPDIRTLETSAKGRPALRLRAAGLKNTFRLDRAHPQSSRAAMVLCYIFGTLLAVSHHFFYQHLNGTMVMSKNNQEWALRFGNAFALATKAVLVATVGIAYTQHVWTAFRRQALTVEGIDAMVAAPNDVFAFLNRDIWLKCFTGTIIAGLLWYVTCLSSLEMYNRLSFTTQPQQMFIER